MRNEKKKAKKEFMNPYKRGATYEAFLKELAKEKKTVEEYCKEELKQSQIDWLNEDLKHITQ